MFVAVYLKERRRSRTPYHDLKTITGQTAARIRGKTPTGIIILEERQRHRVDTTQYIVPSGGDEWFKTELWHGVWTRYAEI